MIKFRVHPGNNKFLQLIHTDTELELQQIEVSFRRKSKAAKYDPRVKKGFWDGYFNYFEKNSVPIGLWDKVVGLKKFGLEVQIEGLNDLFNLEMTSEIVKKNLEKTLEVLKDRTGKVPYDYQLEAITNILKWVFCSEELATSAGKTLILYLIISYLNNIGFLNKILIVVPNTNLVIQTAEEFAAYGAKEFDFKIKMIYGGEDETIGDANIIIGTYQSLTKKDSKYFKDINVITIDECHSVNASSVKKIINLCSNAIYRFGVSGTITDDDSAEAWTAQAFLGPQVMKVSPDFLMKEGYATQVKIKQFHLNYISDEIKGKLSQLRNNRDQVSGSKLLNLEEQLVVDNEKRFYFVVNLALKTTKNTVMLFSNVKDNYGKRIYDEIRERTAEKEVFYIFGGTSTENREYIFKKMEEGTNKILVASFGTVATGISIKNIGNIIFLESYKSSTIIKQSIGRGMRLHGDKEGFTVIDLVDDFRSGKTSNYLYQHGKDRLAIYNKEKFPVEIFKIDL